MMDGCTLLDFKSGPPFTDTINLELLYIYIYISDCIRLKEESHVHLGWLEVE